MEGLIIGAVIVIGIVIFFMYASRSGARLKKEREERLARAENGRARILGFGIIGLRGTGTDGSYQAYKFTLEVSNAFKTPYKATSVWEVYPMGSPKVQEGSEIDVKIDAQDNGIIYPMVQGVKYSWTGMLMDMARNK